MNAPSNDAAKRYFIKWGLISAAVLVVLVVVESALVEFDGQSGTSGQRSFESFAEFIAYQDSLGYLMLGRFHDQWPAQISEERTAVNEISFELRDGTRHTYPDFDGYEIKLTRLVTPSGGEGVVVVRSKSKQPF